CNDKLAFDLIVSLFNHSARGSSGLVPGLPAASAYMKFCSECAQPVTLTVPPFDNRPRYVCKECGTIHYQNPKLVVGSIPVWELHGDTKILLCKRAIEPRHGYWTLPAGFMENNETTADAAA